MIDRDAVSYAPDHPAVLASLDALSLGCASWQAARDECYAWLTVRDNLNPNALSNVGERHICWTSKGRGQGYVYHIQLKGPWGVRQSAIHAPSSLEEARVSPLLEKAIIKRDALRTQLVVEYGEPRLNPMGLSEQMEAILLVTPEGRERLGSVRDKKRLFQYLAVLASTAAAYERDEWNPINSRDVHSIFRAQPDRVQLIKREWSRSRARDEIIRRNDGGDVAIRSVTSVRAHARVKLSEDFKLEVGLMVESGISPDQIADATRRFAQTLVKSESVLEAVAA